METRPKHEQIRDYLLSEASAGRIPIARDVAAAFSVARTYVHQIRSELIAAGRLPHSPRGRSGQGPPSERLSLDLDAQARKATKRALRAATRPLIREMALVGKEMGIEIGTASKPFTEARAETESIFDGVLSGTAPIMTTDQRRAFLSELALRTHRHEIKVSALAALNRLEASLRSDSRVGPPDPLSMSEADERIVELQRARFEIFGRST